MRVQIHLDDARELRVGHRVEEPRASATVGELAAGVHLAGSLRLQQRQCGLQGCRRSTARHPGTSQFEYCAFAKCDISARASVVLPTWRAPVSTTILRRSSASTFAYIDLSIMMLRVPVLLPTAWQKFTT
jgi:hypothetical protein